MAERPPYCSGSTGAEYDWEMDLVLACGQFILAQIAPEPMLGPTLRIFRLLQIYPARISRLAEVEPSQLSELVADAKQSKTPWADLRALTRGILSGLSGYRSDFLNAARLEGAPPAALALFAAHAADFVIEGENHFFTLRNLFAFLDLPPGRWGVTALELVALSRRSPPPFLADSCGPGGTLLDLTFTLPEGAELLFGLRKTPEEAASNPPEAPRRLRRPDPPARPARPAIPTPGRPIQEESAPVCTFVESGSLPGLSSLVVAPEVMEELRYALALCARTFRARETEGGPCEPAPRLLFHGPPGTGKTHAARALAHDVGRPLALVLPGALLQKWVGETEKAIERAFQEAAGRGALLFLDEADSFLYDRRNASQSHQLSCVNALLNQLERAAVPVILCTNLIDTLDPALHRRMDHLLEFPAPGPDERRILWEKELVRAQLWRCRPDYDRLAELPLTGGLIHNAVTQAARRRLVNGDAYTVDTASLLGLGRKELPKMGDGARGRAPIGFADPAPATIVEDMVTEAHPFAATKWLWEE